MRWWPKTSAIMFDPGATGLRAVQAERRGTGVRVRESIEIELSQPAETPLAERLDETVGRLARAVQSGCFRGRSLGLVLSPPTIGFHPMRAPEALVNQPAVRVREALAWELAREFRVEPGELELRYWPLPRGHRENLNLMVAHVPAGLSDGLVQACGRHGLRLMRIDAAPCAQARACAQRHACQPQEIWAVVDIGHSSATVTTLLGETPVYIRTLPCGAAEWQRTLAETLGVSVAEAGRVLRTSGVMPGGRSLREGAGLEGVAKQDVARVVAAALGESLAHLHLNVRRCLTYAEDNYPEARPARLFLAGRGGSIPGLCEYLSDTIGVSVASAAPDAEKSGPALTTAYGAALLDLEAA